MEESRTECSEALSMYMRNDTTYVNTVTKYAAKHKRRIIQHEKAKTSL